DAFKSTDVVLGPVSTLSLGHPQPQDTQGLQSGGSRIPPLPVHSSEQSDDQVGLFQDSRLQQQPHQDSFLVRGPTLASGGSSPSTRPSSLFPKKKMAAAVTLLNPPSSSSIPSGYPPKPKPSSTATSAEDSYPHSPDPSARSSAAIPACPHPCVVAK
ncbi:hypothetical protein A4X13_0g9227, partial [Tilletia indica]